MEARRFYIITGGTMVHVAPHFSLCAPAYGAVGVELLRQLQKLASEQSDAPKPEDIILLRTRMALGTDDPSIDEVGICKLAGVRRLETNEDLERVIDYLVSQKSTKGIILAAAVCDWEPVARTDDGGGETGGAARRDRSNFGKDRSRLHTSVGRMSLELDPAAKIIKKIRQKRKDIFLVGFKATTGLDEQAQYIEGLGLLKGASCNLVFANDVHCHRNMVITPEEAKYHITKERKNAIRGLCEMILMRSNLTFTRSIVVDGAPLPWESPEIPANLRAVVDHCIARGAYKPFRGSTVGHFATRGPKGVIYTSRRKSNFNNLAKDGLLKVELRDNNTVVAYGGKPSVGGQSQRIIFEQHPDVDCIVHFHCPLRPWEGAMPRPPMRSQRAFECGSHECGKNTSDGLKDMVIPRSYSLKAVMLDEHGPNICFSRNADPKDVIHLIETFWDLEQKTGGPVSLPEHGGV